MRCGICLSVNEKLISSKQGLGKIVWCGLMFVSQLMSGLSSDRCHRHQPIRGEYAGWGPIRGGHLSPTQLAWCEKKLQYLFYIRRKLEELVLLVGRSQDSCGKDCQTLPAEFTPSNIYWVRWSSPECWEPTLVKMTGSTQYWAAPTINPGPLTQLRECWLKPRKTVQSENRWGLAC